MALHEFGLLIERVFLATGGPASLITGDPIVMPESPISEAQGGGETKSQHPMEVAGTIADKSGGLPGAIMSLINALLKR